MGTNATQELAIALIQNDIGAVAYKGHHVVIDFWDGNGSYHIYEIAESVECDGLYTVTQPHGDEEYPEDVVWMEIPGYVDTTIDNIVAFINTVS